MLSICSGRNVIRPRLKKSETKTVHAESALSETVVFLFVMNDLTCSKTATVNSTVDSFLSSLCSEGRKSVPLSSRGVMSHTGSPLTGWYVRPDELARSAEEF